MKKVEMVFVSLCLVLIVVSALIAYFQSLTVTIGYPIAEELKITGVTFQTGIATISVRNRGVYNSSISSVTVDDLTKTVLATGGYFTGSGPYELARGESGTITIGPSWTSGNNYTFAVITTKGNQFPYRATAP